MGEPEDENEITPDMIEAAMNIVWETDLTEPREDELREMVRRVFITMREKQQKYRRAT